MTKPSRTRPPVSTKIDFLLAASLIWRLDLTSEPLASSPGGFIGVAEG
jgi:hypothetical protein